MRVLLDTHALIWALTEPAKLSPKARNAITDPHNELLVSSASAWEIATKFRLGKLPSLEATVATFEAQLSQLGAVTLAVSVQHSLLAGGMAWSHRDPFDRMLAAQSTLERAPLVTSDTAFAELGDVATIW